MEVIVEFKVVVDPDGVFSESNEACVAALDEVKRLLMFNRNPCGYDLPVTFVIGEQRY